MNKTHPFSRRHFTSAALVAAAVFAAMPGHAQEKYPSKPILNPMVYRSVPYKISDFQPVGLMGRFNMVVATGAPTGIDSISQAINAMRTSPGKYSYGSVGAGTPHHFVNAARYPV